ncbi:MULTISPECIES: AbfB domain-containing protein [unclassified Streptomyces]|uniref:AbfB domain-containing protein n=1 Tax=unclassified Streptomyces TaxID=2593676 RepID=UPI0023652D54|nr:MULTISPECIES: AbfB domain-containing protein [unclassified Streptomyces]MDF3144148.1 AbfB domain-containing protein [Streptomyces sp. T21Q-yed]WDF37226.1 AbfB domain-containing protein [Streptomyces sp. T12]
MPENKSRPPQEQPWENGWAPDTSRAPGTRRLWLAGGMAVATIVACFTAIAVTDRAPDAQTRSAPADDTASVPGLISFATPSQTPPEGKSGLSTAEATTKAPRRPDADTPKPAPEPKPKPSKSTSGEGSSPDAPKPPATTWRSVRSVNYPDRYWHPSGGYVKLDAVSGSESRADSTFELVKGLADASCYSFATADGAYLRHRNFVLRSERNDGSALFKQDATFCARSAAYSGAVMLESVNYPGRFLRHENFQLRLDPYEHSGQYLADSAFRLVAGLA